MKRIILIFITAVTLGSCGLYRMPDDEDTSTIPTTNNPNMIQDSPGLMPGVQM